MKRFYMTTKLSRGLPSGLLVLRKGDSDLYYSMESGNKSGANLIRNAINKSESYVIAVEDYEGRSYYVFNIQSDSLVSIESDEYTGRFFQYDGKEKMIVKKIPSLDNTWRAVDFSYGSETDHTRDQRDDLWSGINCYFAGLDVSESEIDIERSIETLLPSGHYITTEKHCRAPEGTIVYLNNALKSEGDYPCKVLFVDYINNIHHVETHDCAGRFLSNDGYYFPESVLKKIASHEHLGKIVTVESGRKFGVAFYDHTNDPAFGVYDLSRTIARPAYSNVIYNLADVKNYLIEEWLYEDFITNRLPPEEKTVEEEFVSEYRIVNKVYGKIPVGTLVYLQAGDQGLSMPPCEIIFPNLIHKVLNRNVLHACEGKFQLDVGYYIPTTRLTRIAQHDSLGKAFKQNGTSYGVSFWDKDAGADDDLKLYAVNLDANKLSEDYSSALRGRLEIKSCYEHDWFLLSAVDEDFKPVEKVAIDIGIPLPYDWEKEPTILSGSIKEIIEEEEVKIIIKRVKIKLF